MGICCICGNRSNLWKFRSRIESKFWIFKDRTCKSGFANLWIRICNSRYETNLFGVRIHDNNMKQIHGYTKQNHVFLNLLYDSRILNNITLPAAQDYFTTQLWNSPVQIDLRTLRALGWGEPPQINFLYTNPPRGATFVCWPPPNSLPFREFQMGSLKGVPLGADILGHPLAWCRAQVKWGAHAKFWGDSLCRSGGRPPDIHTHTHTLSPL